MAKSKFEYVKNFESEDRFIPNCWIVVTLDGKCFQRFSELHGFEKPNDKRALELMSRAAATVMEEVRDICLAYGHSDEYSFVFKKDTAIYNRRSDKILTIVNSLFTSAYVFYWKTYFGYVNMLYPPVFEGHVYSFPSELNLKDYVSWRQAELHANNLYSSAFWALVLKAKVPPREAEDRLRPIAFAPHKHEQILKDCGIVYNKEPVLFRKGTTLVRKFVPVIGERKFQQLVLPLCCDITGDDFWRENSEILGMKYVSQVKGTTSGSLPVKRQVNETNGERAAKTNRRPPLGPISMSVDPIKQKDKINQEGTSNNK